MRQSITTLAALALVGLAAGCTSGNSGIEPGFTSVDQNTNKAQFAVGTANIAGKAGLNTVATYRQPNGLSATLLNSPSIVGPTGFVVPGANSAGTDAGTNAITSSPQAQPGQAVPATTFGQSGGLFAYGFAPANSTTSGAANYPKFVAATSSAPNNAFCVTNPSPYYGTCISQNAFAQPLYGSTANKLVYLGGPPAYPYFNTVSFPTGFEGYPAGFTTFAATPVAGTYTLNVSVPSANNPTFNAAPAAATLNSTALLPTFTAPTLTGDGTGGATIAVNVPTGVTEAMIYVFDYQYATTPAPGGDFMVKNFYTLLTKTTGPQTLTLPNNLGVTPGGGTAGPTFTTGDFYFVYAAGFDYPAFEAGPPGNVQQIPAISGANGQTDITLSAPTNGTY